VADGRKWLLLELPEGPMMDIGQLLADLKRSGTQVVLTHPERYLWSEQEMKGMLMWRRSHGMLVQVTAGSLMGAFGPRAEHLAWRWLETGIADIVASDAHGVQKRPPLLAAAWKAISLRLGPSIAARTMCVTPGRVVEAGVTRGTPAAAH